MFGSMVSWVNTVQPLESLGALLSFELPFELPSALADDKAAAAVADKRAAKDMKAAGIQVAKDEAAADKAVADKKEAKDEVAPRMPYPLS